MLQKRSVAVAIILSIVTCGIYAIYWFIKLTDEMNFVTGTQQDTSGGVAFLLSLVTCGIYTYYWMWKQGDKIDKYYGNGGSRGILYLILCFFGLGIISYALIQDEINKM